MASQTIHEAILAIRADTAQLRQDLAAGQSIMKGGLASMQSLALTFAPVLSIGGVIAFGKSVFELGGHLADLSEQTGISGQLLSGMKSVLEESGTSLDAFANGIFKAQKELGEIRKETDPAAIAIKRLGLNLDELRNLGTDQFLEKITDALGNVQNPMERAALGAGLLGRQYRELAPAIQNLSGRLAELRASGMSDEDIRELDAAGDAWVAFGNKIEITSAHILVAAMERLKKTREEMGRFVNEFRRFVTREAFQKNQLNDILIDIEPKPTLREPPEKPARFTGLVDTDSLKKSQDAVRAFFDSLEKQLEQAQGKLKEGLFGPGSSLGDQLTADFNRFKDKLAADKIPIPKGLDAQFEKLKAAILGANQELSTQILLLEQLSAYDTMDQEFGKALAERREEENKVNRELAERVRLLSIEQAFSGFDIMDADQGRQIEEENQKIQDLGRTLADLRERMYDASQLSIALGGSFDLTSEKLEIQRQKVEALTKAYGALDPRVRQAVAELKKLEQQKVNQDLFRSLADSVDRGISDTVRGISEGSQTLEEGMRNLARNMVLSFQEELLKLSVINPIKNWLMDMMNIQGQRFPTFDILSMIGSGQGASGAQQQPNIQNHPNVAAPVEPPIDFEGWIFEMTDGFKQVDNTMTQGFAQMFNMADIGFFKFFIDLGKTIMDGIGSINLGGGGGGFSFGDLFGGDEAWLGGFKTGGLVPALSGVPHFSDGGLAMLHSGEFVMRAPTVRKIGAPALAQMNETGRMPAAGGGHLEVSLDFKNAQIIPRAPWTTPDDVVNITVRDLDNQGKILRTFERRTNIKSGV
jgi:hypothetical protein